MRKILLATLGLFLGSTFSCADEPANSKDTPVALNFTMKSIDDADVDLSKYQGKVILIVNVASDCGLTPQYKQLQALHDEYSEKGLVILGFPCNQFNGQEPGTNEDIKKYCETEYSVKFDLFSKIEVNGEGACPLYQHLTNLDLQPAGKGEIKWNFEKFLLDRAGKPIARFGPRTKPNADEVVQAIKTALGE